jgi:hypothetical protein
MKASLVSLFGGSAALVVAGVVAVSTWSAPASASPVCYTPYSQASTGTPGPVCGDIQIRGFGDDGNNISVATDPVPAWGNSVSIGAGGGGSGITGLVTVSGSVGEGHIKATSHIDTGPGPHDAQVSARGFLRFVDTFTVGPSDVQANFLSSLNGGFSHGGHGQAVLRVQDLSNFFVPIDDLTTLVNETFSSQTKNALVTLSANHQYSLSWSMEAFADTMLNFLTNRPDSSADLSGTGHLYIDVQTPGGVLTFASGHNYSSSAVTPLPPSSIMMLSALGGLGFLGYRRRMKLDPR